MPRLAVLALLWPLRLRRRRPFATLIVGRLRRFLLRRARSTSLFHQRRLPRLGPLRAGDGSHCRDYAGKRVHTFFVFADPSMDVAAARENLKSFHPKSRVTAVIDRGFALTTARASP